MPLFLTIKASFTTDILILKSPAALTLTVFAFQHRSVRCLQSLVQPVRTWFAFSKGILAHPAFVQPYLQISQDPTWRAVSCGALKRRLCRTGVPQHLHAACWVLHSTSGVPPILRRYHWCAHWCAHQSNSNGPVSCPARDFENLYTSLPQRDVIERLEICCVGLTWPRALPSRLNCRSSVALYLSPAM